MTSFRLICITLLFVRRCYLVPCDLIAAEETIGEFSDNCTMETDTNGNLAFSHCEQHHLGFALTSSIPMGLV